MDFYEAVERRHTVRSFTDKAVSEETLERIISAGLKAPSNNHQREWAFVILRTEEEKEFALQKIRENLSGLMQRVSADPKTAAQKMYAYAIPRQYDMLKECPYVILPFFKAGPRLFDPESVSSMNTLASIWCVIENMFLAAAAEGLATSMHLPIGTEGPETAALLGAPDKWVLACFIGLGYSAETEPLPQVEVSYKDAVHFGRW